MKRSFLIILSIILLTVFTTCALAEKPLTALFDFSEELLFATSNVTITGKAEFTLDGEWFKTAEIKYIQDGDRSFWDLKLTSPKQDGTERHNGYTVIADGSKIYVMEVYRPGIYKTGTGTPQSTLLRKSIQLDLMREMFRMIAEQTEETENSAVLIEENSDNHDLRIRIEENASPKLNLALNLFAQYAARRYFHMDYDQISELHMIPMNAYLTVTEGILASTKSIALKHAEVNIGKDQKGQPEKISGDVSSCSIRQKTVIETSVSLSMRKSPIWGRAMLARSHRPNTMSAWRKARCRSKTSSIPKWTNTPGKS